MTVGGMYVHSLPIDCSRAGSITWCSSSSPPSSSSSTTSSTICASTSGCPAFSSVIVMAWSVLLEASVDIWLTHSKRGASWR